MAGKRRRRRVRRPAGSKACRPQADVRGHADISLPGKSNDEIDARGNGESAERCQHQVSRAVGAAQAGIDQGEAHGANGPGESGKCLRPGLCQEARKPARVYLLSSRTTGWERMTRARPIISTPTPARIKQFCGACRANSTSAARTIAHPARSNKKPASFMLFRSPTFQGRCDACAPSARYMNTTIVPAIKARQPRKGHEIGAENGLRGTDASWWAAGADARKLPAGGAGKRLSGL